MANTDGILVHIRICEDKLLGMWPKCRFIFHYFL